MVENCHYMLKNTMIVINTKTIMALTIVKIGVLLRKNKCSRFVHNPQYHTNFQMMDTFCNFKQFNKYKTKC